MRLAEKAKQAWMALVIRLGKIQTTILLSIVYFVVLGPLSLMMKTLGRGDLLELEHPEGSTFSHAKTQIPTNPERCERQF